MAVLIAVTHDSNSGSSLAENRYSAPEGNLWGITITVKICTLYYTWYMCYMNYVLCMCTVCNVCILLCTYYVHIINAHIYTGK